MIRGDVTLELKTGKKISTTGNYHSQENYIDVRKGGREYPTKLDFKNKLVTSITFKPAVDGKTRTWTTWEYFSHKDWVDDRFTELG